MRKYTNEQLLEVLKKVIAKDLRHKHYKHVCSLASLYKKYMTGDDQKELLLQYKPRETDNQKEQRYSITSSRTQFVSNKVVSVFKKVPRVDNIVDTISYESESSDVQDKVKEIQDRFRRFNRGETMQDYLTEAFEYYSFYDPNAWLLIEIRKDPKGKEKPYTYPVEITSEQAIHYEWADGDLQYLIALHGCDVYEKDDTSKADGHGKIKEAVQKYKAMGKVRKGEKYLLYAPDFAIEMRELAQDGKQMVEDAVFEPDQVIEIAIGGESSSTKKRFAVKFYDTRSQIMPAMQFGYLRDPRTQRETFVSPMHPADKVYRDLINSKSEYDLAKALHGFLQKIQYAPLCDFQRDYDNNRDFCQNGTLSISQEKCPQCDGLGLKVHKSTQDAILIKWPDGKEEHIPLDQAVHYVQVPEHMMKLWKQEVADLERDVSFAIFNTNLFDRSEIAVTATEKRLNMESAYDVLADYADQLSAMHKFIVRMTAIHTQNDEGIIIEHSIPPDFRLEAVEDLLFQRKLAVDAGAPYSVLQTIDLNIESKQSDDPENVEWFKVRERFRPFKEKSKEEIMFILSDLDPDDPRRVLYINYEEIMDTIEEEFSSPPFYKLSKQKQRSIVEQSVAKFILKTQDPESFRDSLNEDDPTVKLRGSVGGVTGLVGIAQAVAEGKMTQEAAKAILIEIYGMDATQAATIARVPSTQKRKVEAAAIKGQENGSAH